MKKVERPVVEAAKFGSLYAGIMAGIIVACLLVLVYVGFGSDLLSQMQAVTTECSIPSGDMVSGYCKANGYEHGWISSPSCGMNEVMCSKGVVGKGAVIYDCVAWNATLNVVN